MDPKTNPSIAGCGGTCTIQLSANVLSSTSHLGQLELIIESAEKNDVNFIYSLSPGLDIVFSSTQDREHLLKKFKQVQSLGCQSFAILFDDINPELCTADKLEYGSSAEAQAEIVNFVYQSLGCPDTFLFCPTEYCSDSAKPTVSRSSYLKTLGTVLHANIKIFWTGSQIIPRTITVNSLVAINRILNRKVVIWDNLHANDYDVRRLFLGPFRGRPASLWPHVSGFLLNPNTEYAANYIPLLSFSSWVCKSSSLLPTADEPDEDSSRRSSLEMMVKEEDCPMEVGTVAEPESVVDTSLFDADEDFRSLVKMWLFELSSMGRPLVGTSPLTMDTTDTNNMVTMEDVLTFIDMYSLPYDFGPSAVQFLNDLRQMFELVWNSKETPLDLAQVHRTSLQNILVRCQSAQQLLKRLAEVPNRKVAEMVRSYSTDLGSVLAFCERLVTLLLAAEPLSLSQELVRPLRKMRCGFTEEIEHIVHFNQLFHNQALHDFRTRPFVPEDKDLLYKLCHDFTLDTLHADLVPDTPPQSLFGDCFLGYFAEHVPEQVTTIQHAGRTCGFAVGTPDYQAYLRQYSTTYQPKMKGLYGSLDHHSDFMSSMIRLVVDPASVTKGFPAEIWQYIQVIPDREYLGLSVWKHLLPQILVELKLDQSVPLHTVVYWNMSHAYDLYSRLSFHVGEEPSFDNHFYLLEKDP